MFYKVAPVLIARFREREENVKLDVFSAFVDLLRQTIVLTKRGTDVLGYVQCYLKGCWINNAILDYSLHSQTSPPR